MHHGMYVRKATGISAPAAFLQDRLVLIGIV